MEVLQQTPEPMLRDKLLVTKVNISEKNVAKLKSIIVRFKELKPHLTMTILFLTHSRTWALNQPPWMSSSTAQMRPGLTTPTRFQSSSHLRVQYTEISEVITN